LLYQNHSIVNFRKIGSGETIEQILKAHPRLTEEAIRAALAFAAEAIRADVVYPIRKAI